MHNDARFQKALELTNKAEAKDQASTSTKPRGAGRGRGRGRGFGYNYGQGYPNYSQFGFQHFGYPPMPVQGGFGFPQIQQQATPQQVQTPQFNQAAGAVLCYNCGSPGHISKHCPFKPAPAAAAGSAPK